MYDYANILFSGPQCNLGCHGCIGQDPTLRGMPYNLQDFPLKNIDALLAEANRQRINDLAFTGTNVDPQMYAHEEELITYCRERLGGHTKLSLHTNGLLAPQRMAVFNSYDKAAVSLHSYNPETYRKMTRSGRMPDIETILAQATIPVKLSMLVTEHNVEELSAYIEKSTSYGIRRIVMRKPKGREEEFPLEMMMPFFGKRPAKEIFGWPVYDFNGVEVTVCGFDRSSAKGLFLFPDGSIRKELVP